MVTLGQALRYARVRSKFTRAQAASEPGLCELTLYRYEQGTAIPDVLALDRLARLYRVDVDLFLQYIPGADPVVIIEFRNITRALETAWKLGAISREEKNMVLEDFCRRFIKR